MIMAFFWTMDHSLIPMVFVLFLCALFGMLSSTPKMIQVEIASNVKDTYSYPFFIRLIRILKSRFGCHDTTTTTKTTRNPE